MNFRLPTFKYEEGVYYYKKPIKVFFQYIPYSLSCCFLRYHCQRCRCHRRRRRRCRCRCRLLLRCFFVCLILRSCYSSIYITHIYRRFRLFFVIPKPNSYNMCSIHLSPNDLRVCDAQNQRQIFPYVYWMCLCIRLYIYTYKCDSYFVWTVKNVLDRVGSFFFVRPRSFQFIVSQTFLS